MRLSYRHHLPQELLRTTIAAAVVITAVAITIVASAVIVVGSQES